MPSLFRIICDKSKDMHGEYARGKPVSCELPSVFGIVASCRLKDIGVLVLVRFWSYESPYQGSMSFRHVRNLDSSSSVLAAVSMRCRTATSGRPACG